MKDCTQPAPTAKPPLVARWRGRVPWIGGVANGVSYGVADGVVPGRLSWTGSSSWPDEMSQLDVVDNWFLRGVRDVDFLIVMVGCVGFAFELGRFAFFFICGDVFELMFSFRMLEVRDWFCECVLLVGGKNLRWFAFIGNTVFFFINWRFFSKLFFFHKNRRKP